MPMGFEGENASKLQKRDHSLDATGAMGLGEENASKLQKRDHSLDATGASPKFNDDDAFTSEQAV